MKFWRKLFIVPMSLGVLLACGREEAQPETAEETAEDTVEVAEAPSIDKGNSRGIKCRKLRK